MPRKSRHAAPLFLAMVLALLVPILARPLPARAQASAALPFAPPIFLGSWSDPIATNRVALGDIDGDGALDLVLARSAQSQVYRNAGGGGFVRVDAALPASSSVALGDLNGDGAPDIVLDGGKAFLNTGGSAVPFTEIALPSGGSPALGDLNGDGALDIVTSGGKLLLNANDGAATFTQVSLSGYSGNPTLGDLDGDGALDIVTSGGKLFLNLNDGSATFAPVANVTGLFGDVELGDLNGDGALDIATHGGQLFLNANDGSATFTSAPGVSGFYESALGDLNGDGALDIAFASGEVYLNNGSGQFTLTPTTLSLDLATISVTLGDVSGDGTIDIVLGVVNGPNRVFLNNSKAFITTAPAMINPQDAKVSMGVAAGDFNADGALDLVLANQGAQSQVYLNDGAGGFPAATALGAAGDTVATRVAVGDMDGDNDLDIVIARLNNQPGQVFRNNGAGQFPAQAITTIGPAGGAANDVAVGDLNGDGNLDIVLALSSGPSQIYLGQGGGAFGAGVSLPSSTSAARGTALGDMDNDGDLDIILVNYQTPSQLFLNNGAGGFTAAAPINPQGSIALSAAVGDLNGDDNLDIVLGNGFSEPSVVYMGDGKAGFAPAATLSAGGYVSQIAVGDLNGDRALDLIVGRNYNTAAASTAPLALIYMNDGAGRFPTAAPLVGSAPNQSVTVGDVNGDGMLDIIYGNGSWVDSVSNPLASRVYLNRQGVGRLRPNNPPTVSVRRPGLVPDAGGYSTPAILGSTVIAVPYTLADPESDPVRAVRAEYSLDGGGSWREAVAAAPPGLALGVEHVFQWDTFASGFFGQSDNVVLRLIAIPSADAGAYSTPIFQRPYAAAATFPFRARGTQVRVLEGGQPVADAIVLRRPAGSSVRFELIAPSGDSRALPFRTDPNGYLRGRGELGLGDTLVALRPIQATGVLSPSHTLFHTSFSPSATGVAGLTISQAGVQTLSVAAERPLALFHLFVSLEWDARGDTRFMEQLRADLARASEILFTASGGRVALGSISIFHDKENWDYADVRIYATNRLRPNAVIGGVATTIITDPLSLARNDPPERAIVYGPGQVRMGAVWNRFGNAAGASLSEDWSRTLAHELSHYLLFLDDTYVGRDAAGAVIAVEGCEGMMSDPYVGQPKFRPAGGWLPACARTFANLTTARADWQTISAFYPSLTAPAASYAALPAGPATFPLAVTEIESIDPLTPTVRLDVPIFYTTLGGGRYLPSLGARGYLFQATPAGPRLTPLGRAGNDQLIARGAAVGDEVCLFDPGVPAQGLSPAGGCATIAPGNERLPLAAQPGWNPDVRVTPVTSRTLAIRVQSLPSGVTGLSARVFPVEDNVAPSGAVALPPHGGGVYSGTVTLDWPVEGAYVRLTAAGSAVRELVVSFAMGGNAGTGYRSGGTGYRSGGTGYRSGGTGYRSGGTGYRSGGTGYRSGGGFMRTGGAPVSSAEGDVLLVGDNLSFAEGQFLLLQSTGALGTLPPWGTLIGTGYRFTTSPSAPDLTGTSLSFNYLGSEVPPGEEEGIQVYYLPPELTHGDYRDWQALPTTLNTYHNTAGVANRGPGTYALLSSLPIRLGAGWTNLGYPVQATRPVSDTFRSIAGQYNAVYAYDPTDVAAPWRLYSPDGPSWLNDLQCLHFGQGYWVRVTAASTVTLQLRGAGGAGESNGCTAGAAAATAAQRPSAALGAMSPPATYYGAARQGGGAPAAPGLAVVARVGGAICGRGQTRLVGGQVVYSVHVNAATAEQPACGLPGRAVQITLGGAPAGSAVWRNDSVNQLDLRATYRVGLPLLAR